MSDSLVTKLRNLVLGGTWKLGERLPTENRLSVEHEASRTPIREALAVLVAEGLIVTTPGHGARVRDWRRHGSFDLLGKILQVRLRSGGDAPELIRQLLWLRRTLYTAIPPLLPVSDELREQLDAVNWSIRGDTPWGWGWLDAPVLLDKEEAVFCFLADRTGNLPVALLAAAIRRCLAQLTAPLRPGTELDPAIEKFQALAATLGDPPAMATHLAELCRLREEIYLALSAPETETKTLQLGER